MSFNDISIFSVEVNDYRIHFWYVSKDETTNLLRNADLIETNWCNINEKLIVT